MSDEKRERPRSAQLLIRSINCGEKLADGDYAVSLGLDVCSRGCGHSGAHASEHCAQCGLVLWKFDHSECETKP